MIATSTEALSDRRAQSLGDRTLVELGRLQEAAAAHVRIVQEYIDAHLYEPLTAGQLAALVGTSVRGLQLLFHRWVGCSPIALVDDTDWRPSAATRYRAHLATP